MAAMKKFSLWLSVILVVLSTLACQLTPTLPNIFNPQPTVRPTAVAVAVPTLLPSQPVISGSPDLISLQDTLVEIYQRTSPAVVYILIASDAGGASGSGFVISSAGDIVTNYHVVEGATAIEVDFSNGFKTRAEVIGTDLDSDIAVLRVEELPDDITPLVFGNSDLVQPGQMVAAIGNPFGLTGTMTLGIVSAKGRTLDSLRESDGGSYFTAGDIIQTDAAINPGNSGGPLLNLQGEVIGINRAIRSSGSNMTGEPVNSGIGFAVASNIVARVVPYLIETGFYDYPYIGISSSSDLTLDEIEALDLPRQAGVYVFSVVAGSPADEAGLIGGSVQTGMEGVLAGGDFIIAVDGRPILVYNDMLGYILQNKSPGDTVVFTILRKNKEMEVTLTLGKRP
jgi:2-alkenal reductase